MDQTLLIRIYNVGLGDCIYLRVPDKKEARHILIDCGNTYADAAILGKALDNLINELPLASNNKKKLDLLVVTHPHQDHIAGFDLHKLKFLEMEIKQIWLSASMDPDHPQAQKARNLQAFSTRMLHELDRTTLDPGLNALVKDLLTLSNEDALQTLREILPQNNKLPEGKPRYVHNTMHLPDIFRDRETRLKVLAPSYDIDGEYLGDIDNILRNFSGITDRSTGKELPLAENWQNPENFPQNISRGDFLQLRERMLQNALAFVYSNNVLINNTSVVLLLEWRGYRLLFTGDAQWQSSRKGEYQSGKPNGSWNVLWHNYRTTELSRPVDFLKIGHHGSYNATPWKAPEPGQKEHPRNEILDTLILRGRTQIVISTERLKYPSIPDRALMEELGKRCKETRDYDERTLLDTKELPRTWEKYRIEDIILSPDVRQPRRTDLEYQATGKEWEPWIDVKFQAP